MIEHSVVSDDVAFDGISAGTVTCEIEDSESSSASPFKISDSMLNLEEGGASGTYEISLKYAPSSNVVIDVISDPSNQVVLDPMVLEFTVNNWETSQVIAVTAIDDKIFESDVHLVVLEHVVTSTDQRFAKAAIGQVHVKVTDVTRRDRGQVFIAPDSLTIQGWCCGHGGSIHSRYILASHSKG